MRRKKKATARVAMIPFDIKVRSEIPSVPTLLLQEQFEAVLNELGCTYGNERRPGVEWDFLGMEVSADHDPLEVAIEVGRVMGIDNEYPPSCAFLFMANEDNSEVHLVLAHTEHAEAKYAAATGSCR